MEYPNRQSRRLRGYDYTQNGAYFITICTEGRQLILGNTVGATPCGRPPLRNHPGHPDKMIEKWLLKLESKFPGIDICDYVIMPNHIHFIVRKMDDQTNSGDHMGSPLRDIVGWFKTMSTNEYIRGVKNNLYIPFTKRLWQRNYYEHIIRDENDYLRIAEYIQNNPLNWEQDSLYSAPGPY